MEMPYVPPTAGFVLFICVAAVALVGLGAGIATLIQWLA